MTHKEMDAARIDEILASDSAAGPMDSEVWSRHAQSLYTSCREYLKAGDPEKLLTELVNLDARHPGNLGSLVAAMLGMPMDRFPEQPQHMEKRARFLRDICDRRIRKLGQVDTVRALVAKLPALKIQMEAPDFASQPNSSDVFHEFRKARDTLLQHPPENLLAVLAETTDPEARAELDRALYNLPGYLVAEAKRR